jgi:DNA-binding response OmpR family regulator
MRRILVIDDEKKLVNVLARVLSAKGYRVDSAHDGTRGLELFRSGQYELVVLDLLLPDIDGTSVLAEAMSEQPDQRVLVLSSLSDVESKVRCLELGASDYLTKPFSLAELLARVRAQMRQPAESSNGHGLLRAGSLTLEVLRRVADGGAGPVRLSEREFLLLQHLMRKQGQVCTREQLLHEVWGYTFDPGTNVVDVYIGRLRAKLGSHAIETVRNVGYCVEQAA